MVGVLKQLAFVLFLCFGLQTFPAEAQTADILWMTDPVLTFALAGIDRFEQDITTVSQLSGNDRLINRWQSVVNGLDPNGHLNRTTAIGGMFFLSENSDTTPMIVLVAQIEQGDSVMESLRDRFSGFEELDSGTWVMRTPAQNIFFEINDHKLILASHREGLKRIHQDFILEIEALTKRDDLYLEISKDGIPQRKLAAVWEQFNNDLDKELSRELKESNEEARLRIELIELIRICARHIFFSTESISVQLDVDSAIRMSLDCNVASDTELSTALRTLPITRERFIATSQANRPLELRVGLNLPGPVRRFAVSFFQHVRKELRREVGAKLSVADRGPASAAFESVEQTIRSGEIDGQIAFEDVDDSRMVLLGGLHVKDSDLLAVSIETILPYARETEDIAEVEMNVLTTDSLRLHRLRGRREREHDRKLYGPRASLYLGTGAEMLWLAAGGNESIDVIKRSQTAHRDRSESIAEVRFAFHPWIRFAEHHEDNPQRIQRLRRAFPDSENDEILFKLRSDGEGLHGQLTGETGVLSLLGILADTAAEKNRREP